MEVLIGRWSVFRGELFKKGEAAAAEMASTVRGGGDSARNDVVVTTSFWRSEADGIGR